MNVMGDPTSFLFEVYVTDFDDNYHRLPTEPSSELEKAARKIRRRYKNYGDYAEAVTVYNEYMGMLAVKHGGWDLFKIKLKNELIEDFVPPKPRMKNTQLNKFIMKNRVIISNIKNVSPKEEGIERYQEEVIDKEPVGEIEIGKATDPLANRIAKEDLTTLSIKKVKEITSIDLLEDYFKNKNVKVEKEKKKYVPSVKEIMSGDYEGKIEDTSETDDVIFYKGNYMRRDTVNELEVYQDLNSFGWNSLKVMKSKNVSKNVTKIMKAKDKKEKKSGKKNRKTDDFLTRTITDGNFDDFKHFEEEMLNFTSDKIFKG